MDARVQVYWLFHLVSVLLLVEQGKVTVGKVKLFGITFVDFLNQKETAKTDALSDEKEASQTDAASNEKEASQTDVISDEKESPKTDDIKIEINVTKPKEGISAEREEATQPHSQNGAAASSAKQQESSSGLLRPKGRTGKKKKSKAARKPLSERMAEEFARFCTFINTLLERLDEGIDAIWEKVSPVFDTVSMYYTFATEAATVSLIKRVLTTVVDFVRYILPIKLQGHLRFGMADPAGMGQICGIGAILFPWYEKNFTFIPDFEKQVMDGEISCRGRIRLGYFVWKILRIVCSRDFWHVIKSWRTLSAQKSKKASSSAPAES